MTRAAVQDQVLEFTATELGIPMSKLTHGKSLMHDLGVAGDDGSEFILEFCQNFNVAVGDFDPVTYFGEEASGNMFAMLFELITQRHVRKTPRLTIADLIQSAETGRLSGWRSTGCERHFIPAKSEEHSFDKRGLPNRQPLQAVWRSCGDPTGLDSARKVILGCKLSAKSGHVDPYQVQNDPLCTQSGYEVHTV